VYDIHSGVLPFWPSRQFCHRRARRIFNLTRVPNSSFSRFDESRGALNFLAIDEDIVLLWTDETKKVITGADLLGRLLRGI
jgi:hypothetical protein